MNFAAALVAVSLGQPPAPNVAVADYYPINSRTIKLPIKYDKDRKAIRQVKLHVARNGENTWYQEAAVPPDRDSFTYVAKEDGVYWFLMVEEDLQGRNIPADLTRQPPDLKVLVDTLPPRVQFTNVKRSGEEIVIEWFVDDKHPEENNTRVHFRPSASDSYWQEVTLPAGSKSGVRFPAGTTNPVIVRVTAYDAAGNKTEATRELGGPNAANTEVTSLSAPATPPVGTGIAVATNTVIPPQENLGQGPLGPIPPTAPPVSPPTQHRTVVMDPAGGMMPVQNVIQNPAVPLSPQMGVVTTPQQTLPTVDAHTNLVTTTTMPGGHMGGPTPVAVWTGPTTPAPPMVEMSRVQVINYLNFDLGYELESRGPSGISRLDLWVTRDEGRTWLKWSQHDGKATNVRVNLNVPANPQPEGAYGFKVVPVSGAGLSEKEPTSGDTPDMRVVVDVTPPLLDLFPPTGDPTSPDTLVIQWKARDNNLGEEPITIEWSEKPTGPWLPVATAGDVVQVATAVPQAKRLANTGNHAWRVPTGLPPRVFLRVTARDAAGNTKELITRDPILVDLVKPRAKISGIVGPATPPR